MDVLEEFMSERLRLSPNESNLEAFLKHCVGALSEAKEDFRMKEAILLAIGQMQPKIQDYPSII